MKCLIFANTPAHAHVYKNAVEELQSRNHDVLVLARDYSCTVELLEWHGLPYEVYGKCETNKFSLFQQLPSHYASIIKRTLSFEPDIILGMGAYSAHAGVVSRTPVILLLDSEPTALDINVSRPFAETIVTPTAFRKNLGSNHYVFDGFMETAYLNHETLTPDKSVREELGIGDEPYTILRLNAFGSHHDVNHDGFTRTQCEELIERLARESVVFVSDEKGNFDLSSLPARLFGVHPGLMHDAIKEASLLVADTQTIVTEAALLGTPVIRSNSFVGEDDMGNFVELENAGLVRNIASFDDVLTTASELLADPAAKERWNRRLEPYLKTKVDLTDIIVALATGQAEENIPQLTSR